MAPTPSSVWATGIWVRSANVLSSCDGAREQDAVAGEDDGSLRLLDGLGRDAQLPGVCPRRWA